MTISITRSIRSSDGYTTVLERFVQNGEGLSVHVPVVETAEDKEEDVEECGELHALLGGISRAITPGPKSNPFKITVSKTHYNCECCGSYEDTEWFVNYRGKEVISFYDDGHMGKGDDLHDVDELAVRVMAELGYEVTLHRKGTIRLSLEDIDDCRGYHARRLMEQVDSREECLVTLVLDGDGENLNCEEIAMTLSGLDVGSIHAMVVASLCQTAFTEIVGILNRSNRNSYMSGYLESVAVTGGSLDDAMALPADILKRYLDQDDAAWDYVGKACPQSTYWDICMAAVKAGVEIPENRKPLGWRL